MRQVISDTTPLWSETDPISHSRNRSPDRGIEHSTTSGNSLIAEIPNLRCGLRLAKKAAQAAKSTEIGNTAALCMPSGAPRGVLWSRISRYGGISFTSILRSGYGSAHGFASRCYHSAMDFHWSYNCAIIFCSPPLSPFSLLPSLPYSYFHLSSSTIWQDSLACVETQYEWYRAEKAGALLRWHRCGLFVVVQQTALNLV